jgi:hypothetical protein
VPREGRLRLGSIALVVAVCCAAAAAVGGQARVGATTGCPALTLDKSYVNAVKSALAQRQDVWGNDLLRSTDGPTYAGVKHYLNPLMLVGPPSGNTPHRVTESGVYYLAFGRPAGSGGTRSLDLHVADGSQIVSENVDGPRLTVAVGRTGAERYGSCLSRLGSPALYRGYLPVLETTYVSADGVRYRQESFATEIPQTKSLVSFVRVVVDPRSATRATGYLRLTPSVKGLRRVGNRLKHGRKTRLLFSPGAHFNGRSLLYATKPRKPLVVYAAWLAEPRLTKPLKLRKSRYLQARRSLAAYWNGRLAQGAALVVPEKRVLDAERNLLIQNLSHAWRYSLGNPYERFSWELIDLAQVMGAYGFTGTERAIVAKSFQRGSVFPNRAAGERMSGTADYYRRTGDAAFVEAVTPILRDSLTNVELQLNASPRGLLYPEQYGVDISRPVYGLHDQALALEGLRDMAGVWAGAGHALLASRATRAADRLEAGLRVAVQASSVRLSDGSLFIPVVLLDAWEKPFSAVTDSRDGSYWNLVMPYALASGLFPPGSSQATGVLRYMLNHGSRFLGLVRFRAYPNIGKPGYRSPGSDDVYGTNVVRFLADNDQPDQLTLSLYGKLGAGMTPNTFVSGEGSTIGPVDGEYYRSMFRPPNSANNAFFLETLRLMLVHETKDANGAPTGLELAFATPRAWLQPGKKIAVRRVQTSFGRLSYSIAVGAGSIRLHVDVPRRVRPQTLKLRLRLPRGERMKGVALGGRDFFRYVPATETINLSGLRGSLDLLVTTARG